MNNFFHKDAIACLFLSWLKADVMQPVFCLCEMRNISDSVLCLQYITRMTDLTTSVEMHRLSVALCNLEGIVMNGSF